jgi:serine/threonine protein kinase/Flp pilus assembly protein TadD
MRCLNCHQDGIALETQICPHCGVHLPTLMRDILVPGTLLHNGNYRIDYALGQGGFGITYRGFDVHLDRPVAIKEFYPQDYVQRDNTSGRVTVSTAGSDSYQKWLQRFEREGQILARLSHPGIVKVHAFFKEQGTAYLVMELLRGVSLRNELEAQPEKRLSEQRVIEIMPTLVAALDTVHQEGVYHLDLKPDNVMVTPDGQIVLVDFGSARQDMSSMTSSQKKSTAAYTPEYSPPELLSGERVGAASDVFELGMMLHEMLTGTRPPNVLSRLNQEQWQPSTLGEPWKRMLTQALRLQPKNRPQNIQQWWQGYQNPPSQPVQANVVPPTVAKTISLELPKNLPAEQESVATAPTRLPETSTVHQSKTLPTLVNTSVKPAKKRRILRIALISGFACLGLVGGISVIALSGKIPNPFANLPLLGSRDATAYNDSGIAKFKQGELQGAIKDFDEAIRLNPNFVLAYNNRAFAKMNSGDLQGAISDYNEAIRLNPNFAMAYSDRGMAKFNLGDKSGAMDDFNEAIRLQPDSAIAYSNRALAKVNSGDMKGAIIDASEAIRLDPNLAVAYNNRGQAKISLGDKEGAISDYNEAIRLQPNFPTAYSNRGDAKAALKDLQGAMSDFNQAVRQQPNFPLAYSSRASVKFELGDQQGAITDLSKAISYKPDYARAFSDRAFIHYTLGNRNAAITDLRMALRLYEKAGEMGSAKITRQRLRKLELR